MALVADVARYILDQRGEMSAMKLQKLMYYAQAWHLVWEEEPLFAEDFQAWANGPVLPTLYGLHRGQFKVGPELLPSGDPSRLSRSQREDIDKVLKFYGDKTAQWLSDLTHKEAPWAVTRGDLPIGTNCERVIPKSAIHEYYSSL